MEKGIRIVVPPEKLAAALVKHFATILLNSPREEKDKPTTGEAVGSK